MDWKAELSARFQLRCFQAEPLAPYTTFRVGGRAESLVLPESVEEWSWLLDFVKKRGLPLTILGLGSNVIISDSGLSGVVASTRGMARIEIYGNDISADSGAALDTAAARSVAAGLAGMEKLSGIPGTVGGAVRMNAGAYGQETFDQLAGFTALRPDGTMQKSVKSEIKYGYRQVSGISGLLILSAHWQLRPGEPAAPLQTRKDTLRARADKQPLDLPSAGSVFKRPAGDFASRLIDSCGLKGLTVGRAQVSPKHAGFIVNLGGATAQDILALIAQVRAAVQNKTGVRLELEQIPLGF
ncbi:MAG: UDP-N-acetylmuramate dehydrogenase [Elusimicrobiota bacterium]|jgi:UDP-N-acetylmuramate dehydrogenase